MSITSSPSSTHSIEAPPGFTKSSWAFQQAVDRANGIASNPTTGTPVTARPGQQNVGGYLSASAYNPPQTTSQPIQTHTSPSPSITISPAATGSNELPQWVETALSSNKISSWSNPNTGQTFYAPGVISSASEGIWVSGPGESGPIGGRFAGNPIQITTGTTAIKQGGKTLYSGPTANAPTTDWGANGKYLGLNGMPDHNIFENTASVSYLDAGKSSFTVTVPLLYGGTFTYTTTPSNTSYTNIQAINQAWNALSTASTLNLPAGSSINANQGNQGLELNIVTNPKTPVADTYTYTLSPGMTVTAPTAQAETTAITQLLAHNTPSGIQPTQTYTNNGITFTGAQLLSYYTDITSTIGQQLANTNPYIPTYHSTFNTLTSAQTEAYVNSQAQAYLNPSTPQFTPGWYAIKGQAQYVTDSQYLQSVANNGASVSYLGPETAFTPSTAQQYANELATAQSYFTANPSSTVYLSFNPSYAPTQSGTGAPLTLTPTQGIEEAKLAAAAGEASTSISPAQLLALTSSLISSGFTPAQADNAVSNLTPAQMAQIQAGTPYQIFFNTPQGISSSYNPTTQSYANWQSSAQTAANQQFDFYNTQIAPAISTIGNAFNNDIVKPIGNAMQQVLGNYPLQRNNPTPAVQHSFFTPTNVTNPANNTSNTLMNQSFNNYVAKPFEEALSTMDIPINMNQLENNIGNNLNSLGLGKWWWNNYGSPKAQLLTDYERQLMLQQQQSLLNQGRAENPEYPQLTIPSQEAYLYSLSMLPQNLAAKANQVANSIATGLGGHPIKQYIPFNPTTNLLLNSVPQQEQNINTQLNTYLNDVAAKSGVPNYLNPQRLSGEAAKYLVLNPAEAVTNAFYGLFNPSTTPMQTGIDLATLGSSVIMPDKAALFGLGSGAINTASNWLFGGQQSPSQAFQQGYQFGAATAPLFEGAGILGQKLVDAIPSLNPYIDILNAARDGDLKTATPEEINTFKAELIKSNPAASKPNILRMVGDFTQENNEANSAILSLDAVANPYMNLLKGMARLGLRTAPMSTLFGTINTVPAYLAGNRNTQQLVEDFASGYLIGTGFQTLPQAFLDILNNLRGTAITGLNPDAWNLNLKGSPLVSEGEDAHLYYPTEINTPEGKMPARFLLATTEKLQPLADLASQINSAAEAFGVDPETIQGTLISNARSGKLNGDMSPKEFYTVIKDSLEGSYINHATPSNFADIITKNGAEITPPKPTDVGALHNCRQHVFLAHHPSIKQRQAGNSHKQDHGYSDTQSLGHQTAICRTDFLDIKHPSQ